MIKRILLIFALFFIAFNTYAQQEKRYVRDGNKHFKKGQYSEAEVDFLRALNSDSMSYKATYNLGATLYKQERFDEAARVMQNSVKMDSLSKHFASANYNLGNSLVKQRKLEEAIESYKSSLRVNPTDTLAKKNLAYAQKLLEDQQNQNNKDNQDNKDNKDNKDNQDNKQNQDQQNNQDNQDNKDDKQNQDNQDNKQDQNNKDNQNQQNQPQNNKMSKEQAEQLLNAIQKSEDNTQEKVNEKKAVGVAGKNKKNW